MPTAEVAADLSRWIRTPPQSYMTKQTSTVLPSAGQTHVPTMNQSTDPIVVSGISLGLPGGEKVFSNDVFERLVNGETCISEVTDEYKQRLLDKNIVRLIKGRDGSVNMERATEFSDIPQLAGVKGAFDLAQEFGIDAKVVMAWDITTQLAVHQFYSHYGMQEFHLPVEQVGKGGLRCTNWQVPQVQRDRTGIVFASCFPGLQMAMKHAKTTEMMARGDSTEFFQTLNMGHSISIYRN